MRGTTASFEAMWLQRNTQTLRPFGHVLYTHCLVSGFTALETNGNSGSTLCIKQYVPCNLTSSTKVTDSVGSWRNHPNRRRSDDAKHRIGISSTTVQPMTLCLPAGKTRRAGYAQREKVPFGHINVMFEILISVQEMSTPKEREFLPVHWLGFKRSRLCTGQDKCVMRR